MQIKIHRGVNQIGGCVTEIKSKKARILIDVGTNLPTCTSNAKVNVANVSKKCDAVFITHYHDDRLYTYRSTFYIRLDKTKKSPEKALYTNMYIIIKSLELLLENDQIIEMKSLITKELDILKNSLTSITIDEVLKVMGFDKDYYIV